MPPEPQISAPTVPLARVGTFIRQLTHDVRNGLNALDLESAFIAEIITDPEAAEELKKLRAMVANLARTLTGVSQLFQTNAPSRIPYQASIFLEDFRDRLTRLHPEKTEKVRWEIELAAEEISVDVEQIITAMTELFQNAWHFAPAEGEPLRCRAAVVEGHFQFEVIENKTVDPAAVETWGREPLCSTRRSGYGLGLYHAREIIAAHGGELRFAAQPGTLRAVLSLPLAVHAG